MTRIAIYLSGKWDDSASAAIKGSEVVLCAPGLRPDDEIDWIELPRLSGSEERALSNGLTLMHKSTMSCKGAEIIGCFLNDYYLYTLRPVTSLLTGLRKKIKEFDANEILVITAKTTGRSLPMFAIQTSESLRGSSNILGARVASLLPSVFQDVRFQYHYVRGDWLCHESIRKIAIRTANSIFFISYIIRTILLHRKIGNISLFCPIKSLILLRTSHQARFAERILQNVTNAATIIFPQISHGRIKDLLRISWMLPKNVPGCGLTTRDVLLAACKTRKDVMILKNYAAKIQEKHISISGVTIPINLGDLAQEIKLASVAILYKNLLSQMLYTKKPDRIINFELSGSMAALEALAARENGVKSHSVQTALVSAVPHPIFPQCDYFYTDSLTTAELISQIGSRSYGRVIYEGPPYSVRTVRKVKCFRKISFFTQPYEHHITIRIIEEICRFARNNNACVTLRLHPRDNRKIYRSALAQNSDVLILEDNLDIISIIENSSVCITRTSSVAKEAIALGCPVILCLWSDFDRMIIADYILYKSGMNYCAKTENELYFLLAHPEYVVKCTQDLQQRMFANKTMHDLTYHLFGNI